MPSFPQGRGKAFPRYDSQRDLTTALPSPMAPESTEGQVLEQISKAGTNALDLATKLAQSFQSSKDTAAELNLQTSIKDIQARAEVDGDINNLDKYNQELDKAYKENLNGVSGGAGLKLNAYNQQAKIGLWSTYEKKRISADRANSEMLAKEYAKSGTIEGEQAIKELFKTKSTIGIFNPEEAGSLTDKYVKQSKLNSFQADALSNPDQARKNVRKNVYGFENAKDTEAALNILDNIEKREEEMTKEFQFDSAISAGTALVNGTLTKESLRDMVSVGQMDSKLAGAYELAIFGPKKEFKGKEYKKLDPSTKFMFNAVKSMEDFNPDSAIKLIESALKTYNTTGSNMNAKDLAWIFRAVDEKRKDKNNPIWNKLTGAIESMEDMSVSGLAMNAFMSTWDMKSDPVPVANEAIKTAQIATNPDRAKYELKQIVKRGNASFEVVGFDDNGNPQFKKR